MRECKINYDKINVENRDLKKYDIFNWKQFGGNSED